MEYLCTLDSGIALSLKDDSSRKRGKPFEFSLGFGEVVPGFEKAVLGMSVGEKKSSTFPPEDGYGKPRAEMM